MIIILAGAILLCGIMLLLYMVLEAHRNTILNRTIKSTQLPAPFIGYTIYFISDIHRRKISMEMLAQIKKVDSVIIGGDLTESGVPFSRVEENLERLQSLEAPIFFVWGNHDLVVNREKLVHLLDKFQVIRLENQSYVIKRQNAKLNFIGVDDATNDRDDLEAAIRTAESGFRILISHNPIITDKIESTHQIPIVLSGHTHGGQIRLFGWGIRESGGIKAKTFGLLVISCGYGTTRLPLRLGAPPDTLLLRLEKGTL